jgi:hypothetical protein
MKNESRIIELLAEMVKGQYRLTAEVSELKNESIKHNLQIAENSRAVLKLADEIRLVAEHEKQISKLELAVFK